MNDQIPPHLTAALMRGLVSRRTLMAGAAGLGVTALAACGSPGRSPSGGGSGSRTALAAPTDLSDTDKVVKWSNWPEYIDVDDKTQSHPTIDAFTKQTGIKVNYTEDYNDNDEFYAKVRPLLAAGKDTGRDVWISTDWMAARLIRLGYAQKLDWPTSPTTRTSRTPCSTSRGTRAASTPCRGSSSSRESRGTPRRPVARRSSRWTSC